MSGPEYSGTSRVLMAFWYTQKVAAMYDKTATVVVAKMIEASRLEFDAGISTCSSREYLRQPSESASNSKRIPGEFFDS